MQFGTGERSAYNKLNVSLRELYIAGRPIVTKAQEAPIKHNYRLGTILIPLTQSNGDYGKAPVAALAYAWSVSVAYLRNCIKVAASISRSELDGYMREAKRRFFPISWGHLIELAKTDSRIRSKLVKAMFKNRLRIIDLKRMRFDFTAAGATGTIDPVATDEMSERIEFNKLNALWNRVKHRPSFRPLAIAIDEIRDSIFGS